jgi:hypothetical protein
MIRTYDDQGVAALQDPEIEQGIKTTALQLSRAGVRLAYVLNEALAPSGLASASPASGKSGDSVAGRQFARAACGRRRWELGQRAARSRGSRCGCT